MTILSEEDEAFNDIERQAKQRKEAVKVAMRSVEESKWIETNNFICTLLRQAHDALAMSSLPSRRTHPVRNDTIEEVAQHIEKLTGFGQDTVSSLAIYIREMKK